MVNIGKTDKETLVEMLTRAGLVVDYELWTSEDETVGVDTKDGSVGFSFDINGNLKEVWGRDW